MKLLKIIATVASAVLLMFILPACGGDSPEIAEIQSYEVEIIDDSGEAAEENLLYINDSPIDFSLLDDEEEALGKIFYDIISPSSESALPFFYTFQGSKNKWDAKMREFCSLAEKKINSQVWSSSFIIKVKYYNSGEDIFEYVYHHKQVQYYRLTVRDDEDDLYDENCYRDSDNKLIIRFLSDEESHSILNSYHNAFTSYSYDRDIDSESTWLYDFEMIGEEDDCNDKIIDSCEEIEDKIGEKTWSASFNVKIEHYKSGVIRNFTHHQAK